MGKQAQAGNTTVVTPCMGVKVWEEHAQAAMFDIEAAFALCLTLHVHLHCTDGEKAIVEASGQVEHPPPAMDSNGTNPTLLFVLTSAATARTSDTSAALCSL